MERDISPEFMINVALGAVGTLILMLLSIIAFFLVRLINQMDKHTEALGENTVAIAVLTNDREVIQKEIESIKEVIEEIKDINATLIIKAHG